MSIPTAELSNYLKKPLDLSEAFSYLHRAEVITLAKHVLKLPKKAVIVNIGAGVGTSALTIAAIRPDLIPTTMTIDIHWESPTGGLKNERNAFDNAGFTQYPIQVLANSWDVPKLWRGWIEMLIIDGGHEDVDIYRDIVSWVPKVDQDGVIAIHDMNSHIWPQVNRVASALLENFRKLDSIGTYVFYQMPEYFEGFPYSQLEDIP